MPPDAPTEAATEAPTEADHRLPRTVVPNHYRIDIEPDLDAATFHGTVDIDVEVVDRTDRVVLNAVDLAIGSASIEANGRTLPATVEVDDERERIALRLAASLEPGPARVSVDFTGILNDQLRGFYRSTYTDDDGHERVLATTQFESTDARRAFPCWDEPDLKATFSVSLTAPNGMTAVSNAPEGSRTTLEDGRTRIEFDDTPVMSTYLVAFIVGDLVATDPVDVDGVPLRIVTPPGQLHLTDFALEAGAHALRYFSSYYDVPYPGDKLDMVAVPDFGFGAMAIDGDGPSSSGEVARRVGKLPTSLGPTRANLINKGIVYAPEHGQIAFTVPGMSKFIERRLAAE